MPNLLVLLVNYRRAEDTLACIASLKKSSCTDFEILVVDNGSHDGSVETLRARYPGIPLIVHEENRGFVGGNNAGLRRAREEGYAHVLLLNNDTVVDPLALDALVRTARENVDAGLVGAKIYYHVPPDRLWFAGGILHPRTAAVSHRGMNEPDTGLYDVAGTCDFVTGCCLLIRRDVLEKVGLLDDDFFAYYEDCDYALRAREAGFRVYYQPAAKLWHKVSSTARWDSPVYHYYTSRNRLLLIRKHVHLLRALPGVPLLAAAYLRQCIRLAVKVRSRDCVRALWMGVLDGVRGRGGILPGARDRRP